MPDLARSWTREDVLALPDDGRRYELVDGALLVSPSPRVIHQFAVAAFFRRIDQHVRTHRLGTVMFAPADLDLGTEQLIQPDIFVARTATGRPPRLWTEVAIPPLIVEVLSPATALHDRLTKRRRFQRSGVPVYWIVDLESRLVEVWRPDDRSPTVADRALSWQPDITAPPLVIDLPDCFREIWGE